MSDEKITLRPHSTVKLSEREGGRSLERWQADYGNHHGLGPTKADALIQLAHVIARAEWEATPPDRRICPTCGIYGGHELGCKDDPNPATRKIKRASKTRL